MVFAVLGFSVPIFVFGYLLMMGLFSITARSWFPVQGYVSRSAEGFLPFLRSIDYPADALRSP